MKCQHRYRMEIREMKEYGTCKLCGYTREFKPEATHWGRQSGSKGNRASVIARQTTGLVELAIKEAN